MNRCFWAVVLVAGGAMGVDVGEVDQSYAGWDVEIGDADNDGGTRF